MRICPPKVVGAKSLSARKIKFIGEKMENVRNVQKFQNLQGNLFLQTFLWGL